MIGKATATQPHRSSVSFRFVLLLFVSNRSFPKRSLNRQTKEISTQNTHTPTVAKEYAVSTITLLGTFLFSSFRFLFVHICLTFVECFSPILDVCVCVCVCARVAQSLFSLVINVHVVFVVVVQFSSPRSPPLFLLITHRFF